LIAPLPACAEAEADVDVDVDVVLLDDAELHAAAVTPTAAMARAEAAFLRNLRVFIMTFSPLFSGWNPMS
jgi:hypothetical protein